MALLIDIRASDWMEDGALRDLVAPLLPGVTIHCGPPDRKLTDVRMLATIQMQPGMVTQLPNLELVQKLGAGVETMLFDANLPVNVRIARLEPSEQAAEIAQYCLAEVLAALRDIRGYYADQTAKHWLSRPPRRAGETKISVLGLGHIGRHVAALLALNGFQVSGWSRTQKSIDNVHCYCGDDGLDQALTAADFVIAVLPSTPQTRGMMAANRFTKMKPGAVFINVGRGDLVVDQDLLLALKSHLGGATLDVFHTEPLPANHPFWETQNLWITPHVSGWSLGDGLLDVAENYKRLIAGKPLLREIDRAKGD